MAVQARSGGWEVRILLVHNHYQQRGGEDEVVEREEALLRAHGHRVVRYTAHNDDIADMPRVALARATLWNRRVHTEVRTLLRSEGLELVHCHNIFPLISPAVYYAARAERVPVVQTLHNYRLLCPSANFFRDGVVCEDCLGKGVPWPGVVHRCYRGSVLASAVTATMLSVHRALGTWRSLPNVYIALSEFAREKFVQGGLPAEKVVVKPNFVDPDPGVALTGGDYVLYVGRLSEEKGVATLLEAWHEVPDGINLKIVGDGPCAADVVAAASALSTVEWLGWQSRERIVELMKRARLLVVPSAWYEGLPMVIPEAYAVGLPVIASDLGSLRSLIEPHRTGLRFRAGDSADLTRKLRWALEHPVELARMRQEARAEFESRYSASQNYPLLIRIYERAKKSAAAQR